MDLPTILIRYRHTIHSNRGFTVVKVVVREMVLMDLYGGGGLSLFRGCHGVSGRGCWVGERGGHCGGSRKL